MSVERELRIVESALARGAIAPSRAGAAPAPSDAALEREADALAAELAARAADPAKAPPLSLRERVLASTRPETALDAFAARTARLLDWSIERAREFLRAEAAPDGAAWLEGPAADIRVRPLVPGPRHGAAVAGLVWCAPGAVFPEHRHHGSEWALVLSGHAENSGGEHWSVGDLVHQAAGSSHSFAVPGDAPPLLAAVVVRRGFELVRSRDGSS